jgi:hypothetical protein
MKGYVKTGKPDVATDTPAHTPGIRMGNEPGAYEKQPGHLPDGRSSAERSSGVNVKGRETIDPRMPHLTPG